MTRMFILILHYYEMVIIKKTLILSSSLIVSRGWFFFETDFTIFSGLLIFMSKKILQNATKATMTFMNAPFLRGLFCQSQEAACNCMGKHWPKSKMVCFFCDLGIFEIFSLWSGSAVQAALLPFPLFSARLPGRPKEQLQFTRFVIYAQFLLPKSSTYFWKFGVS